MVSDRLIDYLNLSFLAVPSWQRADHIISYRQTSYGATPPMLSGASQSEL